MKLIDITGYIVGDYEVCVEDAANEEYSYIEGFSSNDKEKLEQYKDAILTTITPYNSNCMLINVCINYGGFNNGN